MHPLILHSVEKGLIPDPLLRQGIRRLLAMRLEEIAADDIETISEPLTAFVESMNNSPIALETDAANEQHYEVPPEFFDTVLGRHRKYSCCLWQEGTSSLEIAEEASLAQVCERAELEDGMEILELGCGWGSLSLWMASHFPKARITAVSNSAPQRAFIEAEANKRQLDNLTIVTCDMNEFNIDQGRFDRVVSIEMFEHMRNHAELYRRIAGWLKPDGKFFKHVFVHRAAPYLFLDNDDSDWMSRHFFTGGMMPSADLPLHFQDDLKLEQRWHLDGHHYRKTAQAWLRNMEAKRNLIWPILTATYGQGNESLWWTRWRLFFLALEELFGYRDGQEWLVCHYRFSNRRAGA